MVVVILFIPITIPAQDTNRAFLTNGLIAYYPFNGNANDASGNGNHGIAVGAVLTSDRFGHKASAYQFDGTNSYIYVPNYPALDKLSAVSTVSAWLKITGDLAFSHVYATILNMRGGLGFQLDDNPYDHATNAISAGSLILTKHPLVVGNYYHVVVTFDKITEAVFLDGLKIDQRGVGSGPDNKGGPIGIGATPNLDWRIQDDNFNGTIDDVRIYNRVLSGEEIAELHAVESVAPFSPSLTIQVRAVRIHMLLQPDIQYQLETSSDLVSWTRCGIPFIAASPNMFQDVDVLNGSQYFRINAVP